MKVPVTCVLTYVELASLTVNNTCKVELQMIYMGSPTTQTLINKGGKNRLL